jgi:hypothetical protein
VAGSSLTISLTDGRRRTNRHSPRVRSVGTEVDDVIQQHPPREELHREVVNALGVGTVVGVLGEKPALHEAVADRVCQRGVDVELDSRELILGHVLHHLFRKRLDKARDVEMSGCVSRNPPRCGDARFVCPIRLVAHARDSPIVGEPELGPVPLLSARRCHTDAAAFLPCHAKLAGRAAGSAGVEFGSCHLGSSGCAWKTSAGLHAHRRSSLSRSPSWASGASPANPWLRTGNRTQAHSRGGLAPLDFRLQSWGSSRYPHRHAPAETVSVSWEPTSRMTALA